jgi:hypothetical protein
MHLWEIPSTVQRRYRKRFAIAGPSSSSRMHIDRARPRTHEGNVFSFSSSPFLLRAPSQTGAPKVMVHNHQYRANTATHIGFLDRAASENSLIFLHF